MCSKASKSCHTLSCAIAMHIVLCIHWWLWACLWPWAGAGSDSEFGPDHDWPWLVIMIIVFGCSGLMTWSGALSCPLPWAAGSLTLSWSSFWLRVWIRPWLTLTLYQAFQNSLLSALTTAIGIQSSKTF